MPLLSSKFFFWNRGFVFYSDRPIERNFIQRLFIWIQRTEFRLNLLFFVVCILSFAVVHFCLFLFFVLDCFLVIFHHYFPKTVPVSDFQTIFSRKLGPFSMLTFYRHFMTVFSSISVFSSELMLFTK